MKIKRADIWLIRANRSLDHLLYQCSILESLFFRKRLQTIAIERPIFICGLARSGTTMLLELLTSLDGLVSHQYCDFPFLTLPIFWNQLRMYMASARSQPVERPHRDGVFIDTSSPEAMDEPLWQRVALDKMRFWEVNDKRLAAGFLQFYRDHLKKILSLRNGTRLVCKNNYHVARIPLLAKAFQDAQFVIPIRHPQHHVASLARQHRLFCEYAEQENWVPQWLAAAGHFEFGPQRRPFCPGVDCYDEIQKSWLAGQNEIGYAWQWAAVYALALRFKSDPALASRLHFVDYEAFCTDPVGHWKVLCQWLHLPDGAAGSGLEQVRTKPGSFSMSRSQTAGVWDIVHSVASQFGYSPL